jgi:hypothetical protein
MLQAPYNYAKKQKKDVLSLRLCLEADKMLILAEEDLRTGQIPWDFLIKSSKDKVLIEKFSLPITLDKELPLVSSRFYLSKGNFKKLDNGTWLGTVRGQVEFFLPARPKEVVYTLSSTFFVARKKWERSPNSSFPGVQDPICKVQL